MWSGIQLTGLLLLLLLLLLRVQNRNFGDFGLFNIDLKRRNFPSARFASAPTRDIGTFSGRSVSINDLLDFDSFSR